jgi:hypothetical protein
VNKRLMAIVAGVLAVALTVAVAGCGGDDEASASSITKAEFIKKADAICKQALEQAEVDFAALVKENETLLEETKEGTPAFEAIYPAVVNGILAPTVEKEVDEIQALGAPEGDEAKVDAMLETLEGDLETAEAKPKRVGFEAEKIFAPSTELAREYGLKVCGTH